MGSDGGSDTRGWRDLALVAGTAVVLLVAVWFAVPALSDNGGGGSASDVSVLPASAGASDPARRSTAIGSSTSAVLAGPSTLSTEVPSSTAAATTAVAAPEAVTTSAPQTVAPPAVTPAPPDGAAASTLPDGTPAPVIAVFDADKITLSGAVPSEAARERLTGLAVANSKVSVPVVDELVVDPVVPAGVPVRVLEMTSVRFPEGSAEILPDHAAELDRVAAIMGALPNVTVLVVGHSDQRGDDTTNFRLSELRAQAVVSHLVSRGVAPSRLSARAVGEADLLSLADDEAALALNRRTEFVFSGLLLGA